MIKQPILHFLVALSLSRIPYPSIRRDDSVVDDYFGVKIADPYRWLEDLDSEETRKFVDQQNNLTYSFLEKIPARENIRKRLTDMMNFTTVKDPRKAGNRYFIFQKAGMENQSVMYVQDSPNGTKTKFLDPNTFSQDGTNSLDSYAFSWDGEILAYSVSSSGSDSKIVRFRNVSSMNDLPDTLLPTKWPTMRWSADSKGIFYMRFPSANIGESAQINENGKVFYHKIGTPQEEDLLVAEFPETPKRFAYPVVSDCGNYLIIRGTESSNATTIFIGDLKKGIDESLKQRIVPIFPNPKEAYYSYVTNEGSTFLFRTNKDAPNYKLISVTVNLTCACNRRIQNAKENLQEGVCCSPTRLFSTFLEEHKTKVLDVVSPFDSDKLILRLIEDVTHKVEIRSLRDASLLEQIDLPAGSVSEFYIESKTSDEFFFMLTNFMSPGTIYHCKSNGGVKCKIIQKTVVGTTDFSKIITEQVFYSSKDGTRVPMYIVRPKNISLDGSTPALLHGYGGFSSNKLPSFKSDALLFVENFGGIYVLANIRGGGEYGEKWHNEGSLLNKQNGFDDFIAAAEYLIQNNYTSTSKLTIQGGSNGGLVVAACVNQRPELFGAALPLVGVMDMLRFQKFTIGYMWCLEYGCSDNQTYFEYLLKYSPLHNIRVPANASVQYPAILATTADHDDRVVPSHSFKYMAQLQHVVGQSPQQTNPLLLRIGKNVGHGQGKSTSKWIDENTDIMAFIAETLGLEFKE